MRVKVATLQHCMLGLALIAALCWNLAHAAEVTQLRLQAGATGTRAEVQLDRAAPYQVISLANPDRLVIDLPSSSLAAKLKFPAPAGLVKAVRSGTPVAGTVRLVFDLASPVVAMTPRIETGAAGPTLVLEWPGDDISRRIAELETAPPAAAVAAPIPAIGAGPRQSDDNRAAASTSATERLIASLPAPTAAPPAAPPATPPAATVTATSAAKSAATSAAVPAPVPTQRPATMPTTGSATGAIVPGQTRIATGIPTRVATGVPAPAPGSTALAQALLPVMPAGARMVGPSAQSAQSSQPAPPPPPQVAMRAGLRPLVIAIDPGHGGQDSGAVGPTGKREKDVVLQISRELARQVNATPGLRAFLTRDSDVFIPLPRRAQLARNARADIFVSVHADAAENRNAQGSSVYVLSLRGASSQRARWLADKENAADLIGGVRIGGSDNTLASVLLDLTQSGHMKASEDAAEHVLDGLKLVGNNHKPNIERANFAVLRTSDMPSMLVETAFISNAEEERRLFDPTVQRRLANAVLAGINAYFTSQPPPGTLYAARAVADAAGAMERNSGGGGGGSGGSP